MPTIKDIEALIQTSYSGDGYMVSRVTGKALIVTLPGSCQNIDGLMVDLRAMGCAVHLDQLVDEKPPKTELYICPGAYPAVSDSEDDDLVPGPLLAACVDPGAEPARRKRAPRAASACSIVRWVLAGAALLLILLSVVVTWHKTTGHQPSGVHN